MLWIGFPCPSILNDRLSEITFVSIWLHTRDWTFAIISPYVMCLYNIHNSYSYHCTFALHRDIWIIKKRKGLHLDRAMKWLIRFKFSQIIDLVELNRNEIFSVGCIINLGAQMIHRRWIWCCYTIWCVKTRARKIFTILIDVIQ